LSSRGGFVPSKGEAPLGKSQGNKTQQGGEKRDGVQIRDGRKHGLRVKDVEKKLRKKK